LRNLLKKPVFFFLIIVSIGYLCKAAYSSNLGILLPEESLRVKMITDEKALVTEKRYIKFHQGINRIYFSYQGIKIVPDSVRIEFVNANLKLIQILSTTIKNIPTLIWIIYSEKGSTEKVGILYVIEGLKANYNYIAYVKEKENHILLKGMLDLSNNTGREFTQAHFIDKAGREWNTNLKNMEEKRLFLFNNLYLPVQRNYILDYQKYGGKIILQYQLTNNTSFSLYPGKIRIYKRGEESGLTFLGEDNTGLINPGEKLKLTVSGVQDIKIERKLIEFSRINIRRDIAGNTQVYDTSERYEIVLKNQKREKVKILIREYIPDCWELIESYPPCYKKEDAHHLLWEIQVLPGEEKIISYYIHRKNLLPYQPVKPLVDY